MASHDHVRHFAKAPDSPVSPLSKARPMTTETTTSRQTPPQGEGLEPSAPLGRRERNKRVKRARIVAAARKLFAAQGFFETTTFQIAEAADIGTGTLFLYARTKEELLVMVFKDEMLETAVESFLRIPKTLPIVDQLITVFERMVDYHARDLDLTRILLREIIIPAEGRRRQDVSELVDAIFQGFAEMVRASQASGELSGRFDPRLTAQSIFSIYYVGLVGWLSDQVDQPTFFVQLRRQLTQLLDPAPKT